MGLISSKTERGDPLLGTVLQGRYRVEEQIGSGGMGTVYRAVQVPFERHVAVKVLAKEHSDDESITRRFAAEALIISRLRHPNTLKPYDFGKTSDGRLYIVTEYLQGLTLAQLLRRGPIDAGRALRYLGQVCDALAEAHGRGIVHRDIKPANIFIEQVGGAEVVKVLDFGVAKVVQGVTQTIAGTIHGTPAYMSPEQAEDKELDARSDLYSIGIIAFECLTGRAPFSGPSPAAVLLKHIQEPPPSLREALPGHQIRADLEGLVLSLLEKDRRQRPYSAEDVRMQIDAVLTGGGLPNAARVGGSASIPAGDSQTPAPAITPDPYGATVYAGPGDAQLITQRGRLGGLRSWLWRTRGAWWILVIGVLELCIALGLLAWASGLGGAGESRTEQDGGAAVDTFGPPDLGAGPKNKDDADASKERNTRNRRDP